MYEMNILHEQVPIPEEDHERVSKILEHGVFDFNETIREIFIKPGTAEDPHVVDFVTNLIDTNEAREYFPLPTQWTITFNTQMSVLSILLAPKEDQEINYN